MIGSNYIEVFISSMTRRKEALLNTLVEKRHLEKLLEKNWDDTITRKKLMRVIGENNLFNKHGEIRSVRHLLWKMDKGFHVLIEKKQVLFHDIEDPKEPDHFANNKTRELYTNLVEIYTDQEKHIQIWERSLKFQYGALKHGIHKQFKEQLEKEKEILEEIKRIDLHAGELKHEILAFTKILIKELTSTGYFSKKKYYENHSMMNLYYVLLFTTMCGVAYAPEASYLRDKLMRFDPSMITFAAILSVTVPALIHFAVKTKVAEKWKNALFKIKTTTKMQLHNL